MPDNKNESPIPDDFHEDHSPWQEEPDGHSPQPISNYHQDGEFYYKEHRGPVILTMGIVSLASLLTCCLFGPCAIISPFLSILTLVLGFGDLRQINEGVMDPDGRPLITTGLIFAAVAAGIFVIGLILIVIFFAMGSLQHQGSFNNPLNF